MTAPHPDSAMTAAGTTPEPRGIALRCSVVQHVALRSADLARARRFYVDALGLPLLMETADQFIVLAGETSVAVHGPAPPGAVERSATSRTGLDHLALACDNDAEIARIASALASHGIENTGVCTDALFERRFVAFQDPDGIRWEVCVE